MIGIASVKLPEDTQATLERWQRLIDAQPTYTAQVHEGKRLFELHRSSVAFRPVSKALRELCAGARRCHYCEDSAATDIEHIWPKAYYPNLVFQWENYLFGCQRCNRPKSSICDVYLNTTGQRTSIPKYVKEHGGPPEAGVPVLINPRTEDPMRFMMLDLRDTFFFIPTGLPATMEWERAKHTIDLLKLNEADVLPEARHEAYENYIARLEKYTLRKNNGTTAQSLAPIMTSLKKMGHPTVWHEMKRQRLHIVELNRLFTLSPEALSW